MEQGTARSKATSSGGAGQPLQAQQGRAGGDRAVADDERFNLVGSLPFILFHAAAVPLVVLVGISWQAVALCIGLYYLRMFALTGGYHRYFAHRTYKTSRLFQFALAFLGSMALQKGVLWWAAHHRHHHRHSDDEHDVHSPTRRGFLWAHVGWILCTRYDATQWDRIPDFARYPELRWLNRFHVVPFVLLSVVVLLTLGFQAFVWGCVVSTVLLWHGTFTINSLMHVFGRRVYETTDTSRNSMILALITMGEGWHNNHHYYHVSANQGFRWYEVDLTFYILVALEKLGVIWKLKRAPAHVVAARIDAAPAPASSPAPAAATP